MNNLLLYQNIDASVYDKFRPVPPEDLVLAIKRLSNMNKLDLVVDLGAGTGLSTRIWADHAIKVIGVEPSENMISEAIKQNQQQHINNIEFIKASANQSGIESATADIVTAASAFHFMDSDKTIIEIHRILKNNGLFTIYGSSSPPLSPFLEIDQLFLNLKHNIKKQVQLVRGNKKKHNIQCTSSDLGQSKLFRINRLFYLHQVLDWSYSDYYGWLLSQARIQFIFEHNNSDLRRYFDEFIEKLSSNFEEKKCPCIFTYKVSVYLK